jgi:hypothetical protein
MKIIALAALASTAALATPASAGVYVNVESNGSRIGSHVLGTTTDLHVGFEGGDQFSYYIQGGPAVVALSGEDSDWRLSGKAGGSFAANEKLDVYGEVSLLTAEDSDLDNSWGTKIGAKFKF